MSGLFLCGLFLLAHIFLIFWLWDQVSIYVIGLALSLSLSSFPMEKFIKEPLQTIPDEDECRNQERRKANEKAAAAQS